MYLFRKKLTHSNFLLFSLHRHTDRHTNIYIYIYIYIYMCVCVCVCVCECVGKFLLYYTVCTYPCLCLHICYHHVTPPARTSLTFSRHPAISSIGPGMSQGYILYRHRAVVYRFSLLVHVKGSTGVYLIWVLSHFSISIPHVWFV